MALREDFTRDSALWELARLLQAIAHTPVASDRACSVKADALELAWRVVIREARHLDWKYAVCVPEAFTDALGSIAAAHGWASGREGNDTYPDDEDYLRVLKTPAPPAYALLELAEQLRVEPPAIIRRALDELEQERRAALV